MAKRSSTVKIPAPIDLSDNGGVVWIIFTPKSREWQAIIDGLLFRLTRGRLYDRDTGSIVGAQQVGKWVYNNIMTVDGTDLINAVREVALALAGGSLNYDDPPPASVNYAGLSLAEVLSTKELSVTNDITVDPASVTVNNDIQPTPPSDVTVENSVSVRCSCGGCGCGGGTDAPVDEGIDGTGDPPDGWQPPADGTGGEVVPGTPQYNQRQCDTAYVIVDGLIEGIEFIDNKYPYTVATVEVLASLFGAIWIGAVAAILSQLIVATAPGWLLYVVANGRSVLDELVQTIAESTPDFSETAAHLTTHRDEYACALYESGGSNVGSKLAEFLKVSQRNDMPLQNQALLSSLMIPNVVATMFYTPPQRQAEFLERLAATNEDCSECEPTVYFPFAVDLENWYLDPTDGPYPPVNTTNQSLVWTEVEADEGGAALLEVWAINHLAHCRSPNINYFIKPGENIRFDAKLSGSDVSVRIHLFFTDGTQEEIYSCSLCYGLQNPNVPLSPFAGKTIEYIYVALAGNGPRDLTILYVDIQD